MTEPARILIWVADTRSHERGPLSTVGRVGQRVMYRLTPLADGWTEVDFRLPGSCDARVKTEQVIDFCEGHFKTWIGRFSTDLEKQWPSASKEVRRG